MVIFLLRDIAMLLVFIILLVILTWHFTGWAYGLWKLSTN